MCLHTAVPHEHATLLVASDGPAGDGGVDGHFWLGLGWVLLGEASVVVKVCFCVCEFRGEENKPVELLRWWIFIFLDRKNG